MEGNVLSVPFESLTLSASLSPVSRAVPGGQGTEEELGSSLDKVADLFQPNKGLEETPNQASIGKDRRPDK